MRGKNENAPEFEFTWKKGYSPGNLPDEKGKNKKKQENQKSKSRRETSQGTTPEIGIPPEKEIET